MRLGLRLALVATCAILALAVPLTASAGPKLVETQIGHSLVTHTRNMHPLGFAEHVPEAGVFNSDITFWGNRAYQGSYNGFHILDISDPENPTWVLKYKQCAGNQGDVVVYGDILVRAWNSPVGSAGSSCGGTPLAPGFEGLNIFDISNELAPVHVGFVDLPCGTHTLSLVPDLANNRVLIYNSASSGSCPWLDIVGVPLANPGAAALIRNADTQRGCHDTAIIMGDVNRVACSGGGGFSMLRLNPNQLDNPTLMYSKPLPDLGGHSAAFTWDGSIYVHGWEPGGGSNPRCTATGTQVSPTTIQTDDMKSYFFWDTETGTLLGKFVMPRPQTLQENCTIHNYNIVPTHKGNVLVAGNYQSGVSVVDFTDPAAAQEIAFADPAPLVPTQLGGAWSAYWYNGHIYETDITRGVVVWKLSAPNVAGAVKWPYSNPQTQEFFK
jgi:hypothetical protein